MNVALCDDDKMFIEDLRNILLKVCVQENISFNIDSFSCGEELIQYIDNSSTKYDLIFLDIIMDKLNGIETAKYIRNIDKNVQIVFLTISSEFALDGYNVKALNYLIKPAKYETVLNIIHELYHNDNKEFYTFKIKNTIHQISLRNINYFEVRNRLINISCIEDTCEENSFYKKLDDVTKELEGFGFIRCHRSYLINLKNVASISSDEVIFKNGDKALVSRRYSKHLKDEFLKHLSNMI
ncbi:MAG: LytR/AlgR family response regulator transcription factor [Peptostreptococcaceae bacterium]